MVHVVLGPLNFDVSNDAAFGAVVAVVVVPLTGVVMGRLTGFGESALAESACSLDLCGH
jgi:hypothetical protein